MPMPRPSSRHPSHVTRRLRFLIQVNQMLGEDIDFRILNSVSIIEEGFEKQVRALLPSLPVRVSS